MFILQLPNISDSLQTVSELLAHHLADHVKNGKKQFDDIKQNIDMAVHDSVPQIIDSIRTAGKYSLYYKTTSISLLKKTCIQVKNIFFVKTFL